MFGKIFEDKSLFFKQEKNKSEKKKISFKRITKKYNQLMTAAYRMKVDNGRLSQLTVLVIYSGLIPSGIHSQVNETRNLLFCANTTWLTNSCNAVES